MGATLLIMAAGMGSRYGGNKQVDGLGPNGEILMEYSIHDAIRAAFDHAPVSGDFAFDSIRVDSAVPGELSKHGVRVGLRA